MSRLVLEFAVRAALIALGTAGVLRLLRVKSAGARHAAWAGVLALMMLLPGWTAWGPRASVRVLPAIATHSGAAPEILMAPLAPSDVSVTTAPGPRTPARSWDWRIAFVGVYLAGALALLSRLAVGTWRARTLVKRAGWSDGKLTSDACVTPVTVGVLRPVVILPRVWRSWPRAKVDAVMAHEGEHARRKDPLVQWLALLNRAVFWFHPLAWWLERRLSALAEEACDSAVLARGCDPYQYSEYLLEMARSIERVGSRVSVLGMAMPGSSLPQRIRQILSGGPAGRMSPVRVGMLAAGCLSVSALFAMAQVERQIPPPPAPPQPPSIIAEPAPPPPPAMPSALVETAPPPPPATPPPSVAATAPAPPPVPPAPAAFADVAPPPPPPPPAAPMQEQKYNSSRRLIALYIDPRGMSEADQTRAIDSAEKFVLSKLGGSDLVSVIALRNGKATVIQDFTDDRDAIARAVQSTAKDSRESTGTETAAGSIVRAVQLLAPLSGKKLLLYFNSGLAAASLSQTELQGAIRAAMDANIAIYPIDSRGLVAIVPEPVAVAVSRTVTVTGNPIIDGKYTVDAEGVLTIPQIGVIKAAGLTAAELRAIINDRLMQSGIAKDPHVTVSVSNLPR